MAILWEHSLQPWTDINGDPYVGAKAYFFDAGTTTPKIVYKDAALSNPHDHPVIADSGGQFPAIFITEQTTYRIRITTASDATLWDVDGISAPTTVPPTPPSGSTPAEFLYQTGDIKMAWRSAAPTGYVRCNGRTIGSASSAATERANADCQALFIFLWEQSPDNILPVVGGRGATSAGDWAANKSITLPNFRGYTPVGLTGMGNAVSNIIPTDLITGGNGDSLGATGGSAKHTLTVAQLPAHDHGGVTGAGGSHQHDVEAGSVTNAGGTGPGDVRIGTTLRSTTIAPNHTHSIPAQGSGEAHSSLQPSVFVPYFIKL